jgi:hypothetical protein
MLNLTGSRSGKGNRKTKEEATRQVMKAQCTIIRSRLPLSFFHTLHFLRTLLTSVHHPTNIKETTFIDTSQAWLLRLFYLLAATILLNRPSINVAHTPVSAFHNQHESLCRAQESS